LVTERGLGVLGPARLPDAIRDKLSESLVAIANDANTQAKLRAIGFEPLGKDAAEFEQFYLADIKRWTDLVKERGRRHNRRALKSAPT
jgi:tripartite-type tricarboxylate transporter receptor subunit TctC